MGVDGPQVKLGSTRRAYADALIELGRIYPNLVVLDADLALSTQTIRFKQAFPDRFFDLGISEADMVNTAAGLASCGKLVYCSSFVIFVVGKAWEEIRNTAAYSRLPVKIVATHSGLGVGADGASHQCLEDLALMRVIPEMVVVAPADPVQTHAAVRAVAETPGVAYIRITRQDLPIIYETGCEFQLGRAISLRPGSDVGIIATGTMVYPALRAADMLSEKGVSAWVVDMHTIKPLDTATVLELAQKTQRIVTCEEHSIVGGLGSAVAEVLSEHLPTPLRRIGVRDRFGESGSPQELYEHFGLTSEAIVRASLELLQ